MNHMLTKFVMALLALSFSARVRGADAPSATIARFSGGTTVEVVGIAENHDAGGKWWLADGSTAADPRFSSAGSMSGSVPGMKMLQLIARVSPAEKTPPVARVGPGFDQSLMRSRNVHGDLFRVLVPVATGKRTLDLRFGLADGPATDVAMWDRTGGAKPIANEAMKFIDLVEEDDLSVVHLQRAASGRQAPAAGAVAKRQVTFSSSGGGGGGMSRGRGPAEFPADSPIHDMIFGGAAQDMDVSIISGGRKVAPIGMQGEGDSITLRFRCPVRSVDKVILSTREYQWIEFQNISASPAATPTDVKVVAIQSSTTQPSTTGAADASLTIPPASH